jgi:4-hydroxybenzoate polyprenyltransferase
MMDAKEPSEELKPAPRTQLDRPLCVDLDGTLLATDVLWESLLLLLKQKPFSFFLLPLWLLKGKAFFKRQLANRVALNPASLPYRENVLSLLQEERGVGRELILATASDQQVADSIAQHLGIFSTVLASDGQVNLSGRRKLEALKKHVDGKGFDYAGDAAVDLPLWQAAHQAILVHPSPRVLKKARRVASVHRVLPSPKFRISYLVKALRVHQWIKNILLFVPLALAHKVGEPELVVKVIFAFVAYSLCASGVYVLNDLLDLESDRLHPRKRNRPFASGILPLKMGVQLVPFLLAGGFSLAALFLPPLFRLALGLYFVLTTAYSLCLKSILIVDVIVLAGLYAFRVLAGALAAGVSLSPWLLMFSIFFFLSLAFVKRYSELCMLLGSSLAPNKARGYVIADIETVRSIGTVSGCLSVLVLALYTSSREVVELYSHPVLLWLIEPFLLYWIIRIWFLAHRGKLDDDPIVFAGKDPTSYAVGGAILLIVIAASF